MSDVAAAPPDPGDPTAWIKRLTEFYRSVRFPGGVVGKTTQVMLALVGVWAVIAWQASDNLSRNVVLLLGGLFLTGVVIWWVRATQSFAERNPAQAMVDGAQFIEYKKFEAQVKGFPPMAGAVLTTDPSKPPPITGTSVIVADE